MTDFSEVHADELAERIALKVVERLRATAPEPVVANCLLSKAELAHALRRSTPTIDRWAKQGMPFSDMGSYRLYDLAVCRRWVAGRPRPGRPANVAPSASSSVPLLAVRPAHLMEVINAVIEKKLSPGTVEHIRSTMHLFFDEAWRLEIIPENPMLKVKVPPIAYVEKPRVILTDDEVIVFYRETGWSLPVDFHSFRRAFSTGLAEAGVNAQQAMLLAGHADTRAHALYVMETESWRASRRRRCPGSLGGELPQPRRSAAKT